jgi:hypothetical protein
MPIRVEIYKDSIAYTGVPAWRNSYVIQTNVQGDSMKQFSDAIIQAEAALHFSHVRFLYAVCDVILQPLEIPHYSDGNQGGDESQHNRVFLPPSATQTGATTDDGTSNSSMILDARKMVFSGHNGRQWYRGCLCDRDLWKAEPNKVALKNPNNWDAALHDNFDLWLPGGLSVLRVDHQGKVADVWGAFELANGFRAHSALRENFLRRAARKIPVSRLNFFDAILDQLRDAAFWIEQFNAGLNNTAPFYQEGLKDAARLAIQASANAAYIAQIALHSDRDGTALDQLALITRDGLTSDAAETTAAQIYRWENKQPKLQEGFTPYMQHFESLQRDEFIIADLYFKPATVGEFIEALNKYARPLMALARVDWRSPY